MVLGEGSVDLVRARRETEERGGVHEFAGCGAYVCAHVSVQCCRRRPSRVCAKVRQILSFSNFDGQRVSGRCLGATRHRSRIVPVVSSHPSWFRLRFGRCFAGPVARRQVPCRMSSLTAERRGLRDRVPADITIFDRERIESRCTIEKPREYATGIVHALVDGRLAIRNGQRTDDDGGEVLRP